MYNLYKSQKDSLTYLAENENEFKDFDGKYDASKFITYKLDKTNEEILSLIKECCDDTIKDNIYTKLYITESDAIPEINAKARLVLHFNIYYPGFDKISIAFDDLF